MTLAEYSMTAFAVMNGGRVIAYVPQMVRVYRDPYGASAVSLMTWALFAAANVTTVWYALAVTDCGQQLRHEALNVITHRKQTRHHAQDVRHVRDHPEGNCQCRTKAHKSPSEWRQPTIRRLHRTRCLRRRTIRDLARHDAQPAHAADAFGH